MVKLGHNWLIDFIWFSQGIHGSKQWTDYDLEYFRSNLKVQVCLIQLNTYWNPIIDFMMCSQKDIRSQESDNTG